MQICMCAYIRMYFLLLKCFINWKQPIAITYAFRLLNQHIGPVVCVCCSIAFHLRGGWEPAEQMSRNASASSSSVFSRWRSAFAHHHQVTLQPPAHAEKRAVGPHPLIWGRAPTWLLIAAPPRRLQNHFSPLCIFLPSSHEPPARF